jgi:hypothetical protein
MLQSPLAPTVVVRPWHDPVVESVGYDARSAYVELFWLGILGPTSTWLLRRLVTGLDAFPDGYELDLAETANALGLSLTAGVHSPFGKALNRCIMFGMAHEVAGGVAVRRQIPPLSMRHLRRLPPHLQAAHREWVERRQSEAQRLSRAVVLAGAMLQTGDEMHQVERQLLSLGVSPKEAIHAVRHCAPEAVNSPA